MTDPTPVSSPKAPKADKPKQPTGTAPRVKETVALAGTFVARNYKQVAPLANDGRGCKPSDLLISDARNVASLPASLKRALVDALMNPEIGPDGIADFALDLADTVRNAACSILSLRDPGNADTNYESATFVDPASTSRNIDGKRALALCLRTDNAAATAFTKEIGISTRRK